MYQVNPQADHPHSNLRYSPSSSHRSQSNSTLTPISPYSYHTETPADLSQWNGYSRNESSYFQYDSQSHLFTQPSMELEQYMHHNSNLNFYHNINPNVRTGSDLEIYNPLPSSSMNMYSQSDSALNDIYPLTMSHPVAVSATGVASGSGIGYPHDADERYSCTSTSSIANTVPPFHYDRSGYRPNQTSINTNMMNTNGEGPLFSPSTDASSSTSPYIAYTILSHNDSDTIGIGTNISSSTSQKCTSSSTAKPNRMKPHLQLDKNQSLTSYGKERKRVLVACDRCRKRRIRCTGSKPACHYCVIHRLAETCSYTSTPRRRGPDKVPGRRRRSDVS